MAATATGLILSAVSTGTGVISVLPKTITKSMRLLVQNMTTYSMYMENPKAPTEEKGKEQKYNLDVIPPIITPMGTGQYCINSEDEEQNVLLFRFGPKNFTKDFERDIMMVQMNSKPTDIEDAFIVKLASVIDSTYNENKRAPVDCDSYWKWGQSNQIFHLPTKYCAYDTDGQPRNCSAYRRDKWVKRSFLGKDTWFAASLSEDISTDYFAHLVICHDVNVE